MPLQNGSSDDVKSRRQALHALGSVMLGTATVGVGTSTVGASSGRPTPITERTEITESGRYELVDDLHITADRTLPWLLRISADDVRLDGNGYTITTDTSVEYGGGLWAPGTSSLRVIDLHMLDIPSASFVIEGGDNITIGKCSSVGGGAGVRLGGTIEKLRIRQCEFSGSFSGLNILTSQIDSTIVNNELHDNERSGIRLSSSNGNHISGNNIVNNGVDDWGWGIELRSNPGRPSENNHITGNRLCGNVEPIYVDELSEDKNRIQGNRIC